MATRHTEFIKGEPAPDKSRLPFILTATCVFQNLGNLALIGLSVYTNTKQDGFKIRLHCSSIAEGKLGAK